MLEKKLEDPSDENRVRLLGGDDPEPEVLAKKIEELELRLAEKEEKLLEKDLIFEEVTRLADRTKKKSETGKEDTLELAKKVCLQNSLIVKVRPFNRSLFLPLPVQDISVCSFAGHTTVTLKKFLRLATSLRQAHDKFMTSFRRAYDKVKHILRKAHDDLTKSPRQAYEMPTASLPKPVRQAHDKIALSLRQDFHLAIKTYPFSPVLYENCHETIYSMKIVYQFWTARAALTPQSFAIKFYLLN